MFIIIIYKKYPATRNPQPATRNPQPATRNPKPEEDYDLPTNTGELLHTPATATYKTTNDYTVTLRLDQISAVCSTNTGAKPYATSITLLSGEEFFVKAHRETVLHDLGWQV